VPFKYGADFLFRDNMGKKKQYRTDRVEKKDEFRRSKTEIHPKYVFERIGMLFGFLSVTHKPPKGKESEYQKLDRNPDSKDERAAYISKKAESDNIANFGARQKDMKLSDSDRQKVKAILRKNKKGK